jgi:hypothetical protein
VNREHSSPAQHISNAIKKTQPMQLHNCSVTIINNNFYVQQPLPQQVRTVPWVPSSQVREKQLDSKPRQPLMGVACLYKTMTDHQNRPNIN